MGGGQLYAAHMYCTISQQLDKLAVGNYPMCYSVDLRINHYGADLSPETVQDDE